MSESNLEQFNQDETTYYNPDGDVADLQSQQVTDTLKSLRVLVLSQASTQPETSKPELLTFDQASIELEKIGIDLAAGLKNAVEMAAQSGLISLLKEKGIEGPDDYKNHLKNAKLSSKGLDQLRKLVGQFKKENPYLQLDASFLPHFSPGAGLNLDALFSLFNLNGLIENEKGTWEGLRAVDRTKVKNSEAWWKDMGKNDFIEAYEGGKTPTLAQNPELFFVCDRQVIRDDRKRKEILKSQNSEYLDPTRDLLRILDLLHQAPTNPQLTMLYSDRLQQAFQEFNKEKLLGTAYSGYLLPPEKKEKKEGKKQEYYIPKAPNLAQYSNQDKIILANEYPQDEQFAHGDGFRGPDPEPKSDHFNCIRFIIK